MRPQNPFSNTMCTTSPTKGSYEMEAVFVSVSTGSIRRPPRDSWIINQTDQTNRLSLTKEDAEHVTRSLCHSRTGRPVAHATWPLRPVKLIRTNLCPSFSSWKSGGLEQTRERRMKVTHQTQSRVCCNRTAQEILLKE